MMVMLCRSTGRRAAPCGVIIAPGRAMENSSSHFSKMMAHRARSNLARKTIWTWWSDVENHHLISWRNPANDSESPALTTSVGQTSFLPRSGSGPLVENLSYPPHYLLQDDLMLNL
ncbi:hypothetical protein BT67DRAFT_72587 [Trichocladium antarcticum]|uniref:Uncharacterized protein n=1 Tax=Trichocladium antarcticum TaxID=1450529 RepID=A0AAN6ZCV8_9PEZI|nr:hypothetical protein BT67DRAFT_72587 [Trichocladium antarcticum]